MKKPPAPGAQILRASERFGADLRDAAKRDSVWHATFDGTAQGGVGRMAGGGVLFAPTGETLELSFALPGQGCNNEAELRALITVLTALRDNGARRVHVWGDSDLVIRQLRGEQPGKALRLLAWRSQMLALAAVFERVEATWVPRHRNGRADWLAERGCAAVASVVELTVR